MKLDKLLETLTKVKKGTYTPVVYEKDLGNGITKVSRSIARFSIKYANIKGVVVSGNSNNQTWKEYITDNVFKHKSKDTYYVNVFTSKSPKHHTTSTYYLNGQIISEIEASKYTKIKHNDIKDIFMLNVDNILSIK